VQAELTSTAAVAAEVGIRRVYTYHVHGLKMLFNELVQLKGKLFTDKVDGLLG
jgi:hypothetical protein